MKRFLIIALCVLLGNTVMAQQTYNSSGRSNYKRNEGGFDASKLIFGGGLGLGFGTVTSISVSPVVGYRLTDWFAAGVGLSYQYVRIKDGIQAYNAYNNQYEYYPYKASLIAPSVWARARVFSNIFLQSEFEYDIQSYKDYYYDTNGNVQDRKESVSSPALLLGGGYAQPVSDNASMVFMVMYDVIQHEYSPYRDRIDFRIGLNIGWGY